MNETHGQRRAEQLVCADCDHSEVMLILSQPLYLPPTSSHPSSLCLASWPWPFTEAELLFLRPPQMVWCGGPGDVINIGGAGEWMQLTGDSWAGAPSPNPLLVWWLHYAVLSMPLRALTAWQREGGRRRREGRALVYRAENLTQLAARSTSDKGMQMQEKLPSSPPLPCTHAHSHSLCPPLVAEISKKTTFTLSRWTRFAYAVERSAQAGDGDRPGQAARKRNQKLFKGYFI